MNDSGEPISITITPMRRLPDGVWEPGPRKTANFFMVEIVKGEGEDAEVVVECRDERTAALAARVAAATISALGLVEDVERPDAEAFDDETAAILTDNPTPEVAAPIELEEDDQEDESPTGLAGEDEPPTGRGSNGRHDG